MGVHALWLLVERALRCAFDAPILETPELNPSEFEHEEREETQRSE